MKLRKNLKRKRFGRKRFNRRKNMKFKTTQPSRDIMPYNFYTKMPYGDTFVVTTAATLSFTQFRLNSLHDPYETGIGGQPRGYDQFCQFYQRYLVYGCKVEVWIKPTGDNINDSLVNFIACAYPINGLATPPANISSALEGSMNTVKTVNQFGSQIHFKKYYDIAKIWGVNKKQLATEEVYSSSSNINPGKVAMLAIGLMATDGTVIPCEGMFRLTYYTKMYAPINLPMSS